MRCWHSRRKRRSILPKRRLYVPRLLEVPIRHPYTVLQDNPGRFQYLTRLTLDEFATLLDDVKPDLEIYLAGKRRSPSWVLSIVLVWLAHGYTFRDIVTTWGSSEAALSRDIAAVVPLLSERLFDEHVKWLTPDEIDDVWNNFTGLEGGIAVFDVFRLRIPKPNGPEEREFFAFDKKFHCLKALVACAWNGRILSCELSDTTRGRMSDLTILRASNIADNAATLFPVRDGVEAFGLGDAAYQGSVYPTIHAPYKKNAIGYDNEFNKMIRRYRIVIENVFGQVLGLWRLFWDQTTWPMPRQLLPPSFKLALALTERLNSTRDDYPRSADWVLDNPEPWETKPAVIAYVNRGIPFGLDEFVEDE